METTGKRGRKLFYTGYTNNLDRRLNEHKSGVGAKFCRGKEIELKYYETFEDRKEALCREREIKRFSREQKKELIKIYRGGVQKR